ncbi:ribosome biogenesis GTPase YlqF [Marinimicrobium alkaliphilum]|uniref:ribosome biogenesis GTPase YlqF n=1 Tax=Marinimicrobium alkaliphilum TaxID=2202654 RepID=UPI000DB9FE7C|nr:ribosome biogenesis GTPase YlqF [Marinimicrobium alkaliphilum]
MAINWFPGHMHKARKEIAEVMPRMDVIIELVDARIPFSSENPLVPALRGNTPCIKLLNKADLADPELTRAWIEHLEQEQGITALPLNAKEADKVRQLPALCRSLTSARKLETRGVRALILGVPNVGKSTVINTLAGRQVAKTGNEAGITKAQQRIKLDDDMVLTDTPGFLWPKLSPPECGYRLAITGAIKDTAFEYEDIALFAADLLLRHYPERVKERYRINILPETDLELLEAIGVQRNCVRKGGSVELQKVSTLLIKELRDGMLGPLTLETPEQVEREIAAAREEDERKAQEKAERDRVRKQRTKKNRR